MIKSFRELNKKDKYFKYTFFCGSFAQVECIKHDKRWPEGDDFERFGGSACEDCVRRRRTK